MPNDYYSATGNPGTLASGQSLAIRTEFQNIQSGFDKMASLTGNDGKFLVVASGGTSQTLSASTGSGAVVLSSGATLSGPTIYNPTISGATDFLGPIISGATLVDPILSGGNATNTVISAETASVTQKGATAYIWSAGLGLPTISLTDGKFKPALDDNFNIGDFGAGIGDVITHELVLLETTGSSGVVLQAADPTHPHGTVNVQNGPDTLIGSSSTDTLLNKTLSGAILSGGTVVPSGASATILSGGRLVLSSGAVISSGTAQVLLDAETRAGMAPLTPGGFATGRWYGAPYGIGNSGAGAAMTSAVLHGTLFYNPEYQQFSNLGIYLTNSTTVHLLLGAYGPLTPAQHAAVGSGAPLLGATASITAAGIGGSSGAFTSNVPPGWYILVAEADGNVSGQQMNGVAGGLQLMIFGAATVGAQTNAVGFTVAAGQTFGSGMPATFPGGATLQQATGVAMVEIQK